ncbi:MAG: thiol:disulfide interchange protein DsbD [Psychromonas sp.]|jgi:thiol:disulfide interchange protein DsbD|uniref:protein-disulfide reductase DsbD n=1 Tax=Psychromonas sp. TaxID=1884585 RepID=UPI0039E64820
MFNVCKGAGCFLAFLLLCTSLSAMSAEKDEFLPVDQAFSYKSEFTTEAVRISWQISDGYYLYYSRISATQNGQPLDINFQQTGELKEDEYFGTVKIFKHNLDIAIALPTSSPVTLSFQGCAEQGLCYPPVIVSLNYPQQQSELSSTTVPPAQENQQSEQGYIENLLQGDSLLWKLALFFMLGIGLAFTPCVFPMFPILSSIIVGQSDNLSTRRAFMLSLSYVLGMAFTYAAAGVIVGYFGATANIQLYLQTPWVLILFSILFVILSFSMFGLYELALPRFIQDKLQSVNSGKQNGHLLGVVLMGAISALVVSPCVSAPLAGVLAYISTTGDGLLGGLALLTLALGMGMPLLIIGTGGGRFLPKSGAWMNNIKTVFGVALLAVAVWLLARIIDPQITLLLWSALLFGSGVYLGAFEQATQGWSRFYKALGLLFCLYAVFIMAALFNGRSDPLPLSNYQLANAATINQTQTPYDRRITRKSEFTKALQDAHNNQQILIVDFYADWCISCKIIEKEVFKQPDLQALLSGFMFVQLDISNNSPEQLALLAQYKLFGPPAVLFFEQGKPLQKNSLIGEFSKNDFVKQLIALKGI